MDIEVIVRLSPGQASFEPRKYLALTVEDAASHLPIVEVKLLAEDVFNLLRGSATIRATGAVDDDLRGVPAEVLSPESYAQVGKQVRRAHYRLAVATEGEAERWLADHPTLFTGARRAVISRRRGGWFVDTLRYYTPEDIAAGLPEHFEARIQEALPTESAPQR